MNSKPFEALKYKNFTFLITGAFFQTTALLIQEAILGYFLYIQTKDPLVLGFLGLAEAIPYIMLALFGGVLADQFNRRKIMIVSQAFIIFFSVLLVLVMQNFNKETSLFPIYAIIGAIGLAKGFLTPAASSLKGFLLPSSVFSNGATWASAFWQTGMVLGPTLGGIFYAAFGLNFSLWMVVFGLCINLILIIWIDYVPVKQQVTIRENIFESIKKGFAFVYQNKILFYSISLDLVAVLFGGVIALLPVFAEDILKISASEYGVLRAAPSVGAIITIFLTAFYSPTKRIWRNMLIAVAGFGLATIVFAVSQNFWLSCLMLFLTGVFDSISVVIRQTLLQVVPTDEMRGRVSAVNSVFVASSNEIGAFESGFFAKLFGTVPSVLIGGGFTLVLVTILSFKSKKLNEFKI